jgi:predicted MFS family arabinose efflux permease
MLNHLINSTVGFAWAIRAAAFITMGCCGLGNALIFVPRMNNPSIDRQSTQPSISIKSQLLDTPYMLTLASAFLSALGMYTPIFYAQLFAETKGVKRIFVYNTLAIMNAGSVLGRIVPSWYADKFGAINIFIPLRVIQGKYHQRSIQSRI